MPTLGQRTEDLHRLTITDNTLGLDTRDVPGCPPSSTANPLDGGPKRQDLDIDNLSLPD